MDCPKQDNRGPKQDERNPKHLQSVKFLKSVFTQLRDPPEPILTWATKVETILVVQSSPSAFAPYCRYKRVPFAGRVDVLAVSVDTLRITTSRSLPNANSTKLRNIFEQFLCPLAITFHRSYTV